MLHSQKFFESPAVFISTLAPGYFAGGHQCTLAYLQALTELHTGGVTYVGPPLSIPSEPVRLQGAVCVRPRGWWRRAVGLLAFRHVDRMTPAAKAFLRTVGDRRTVIYVNGELAGRVVLTAKTLGFRAVFLPHNYSPEYLNADFPVLDPIRSAYVRVAIKNALMGCRHSDLCLFLTEQDSNAYRSALGKTGAMLNGLSGMYFGYRRNSCPSQPVDSGEPNGYTVLINTSMGARQNEEGVLFFLEEVWSQVPRSRGWRLILAGGFPRTSIYKAAERMAGVQIIPLPEASEMERVFATSSVCVASSFRGSGIKLRVGEALRRGLPVVSTEHCARGYEKLSGDVLRVFRSAAEALGHLEAVASLTRDDLKAKCWEEYDREMSFETGLRKMSRIAEYFA